MKALLFDLEGTLVESAYQQTPELVEKLHKDTKDRLISLGVPIELLSGIDKSALLRNQAYQWADGNLDEDQSTQLRTEIEDFMMPYDMNSASKTVLYPETLNILTQLSNASFLMGIATNTSSRAANYIIDNHGLSHFFKVVVSSSDALRLKPDPAMVHLAATKLQRAIGWLVGDSVLDAEAANRARTKSIITRRDGSQPSFECDVVLPSLEGVPSIVLGKKGC